MIFSWIWNWDISKYWLDFGDLDLIFKVTAVEKLKIHGGGHLFSLKMTATSYHMTKQEMKNIMPAIEKSATAS